MAATALGVSLPAWADIVAFEDGPRKVLKKRCVACHRPDDISAGLDLSTYEGVLEGSASGEVVVAGAPEDSYLYLVTAHLEEPVMPPGGHMIPEGELDLLRRWIESGLPKTAKVIEEGWASSTAPEESVEAGDSPGDGTSIREVATSVATPSINRSAPIVAMAAHPAETLVAIGIPEGILLLDTSNGKADQHLQFPTGQPVELAFSEDGKYLTAAGGLHGQDGRVCVYETTSGAMAWQSEPTADAVLAASLHPSRTALVHGGTSRRLTVVDTLTREQRLSIDKHSDWVTAVAYSPDGILFASGDRGGGLYVWESNSGAHLHTLRGHKSRITSLVWLNGGDRCVSASDDGQVIEWDMHTGEMARQVWRQDQAIVGVCAAGDRLAAASREGSIACVDPSSSEAVIRIKVEAAPTSIVLTSSRGLAVGDFDGNVHLRGRDDTKWSRLTPSTIAAEAGLKSPALVAASLEPMTLAIAIRSPMRNDGDKGIRQATEGPIVSDLENLVVDFGKTQRRLSSLLDRTRVASDRLKKYRAEAQRQTTPNELVALEEELSQARAAHEQLIAQVDSVEAAIASLSLAAGYVDQLEEPSAVVATELIELARGRLETQLSELTARSEQHAVVMDGCSQRVRDAEAAKSDLFRNSLEELRKELRSINAGLADAVK
ncbi:MAG: c-type cytochrome domain-containing protein [Planctomycetota bacterium]